MAMNLWRRLAFSGPLSWVLIMLVNVYVKVNKDSPVLVCMDEDMARKETVDPHYVWVGPKDRILRGYNNVNITETGKLILKSFDKSMSGSYSCTFSYGIIKRNNNEEEKFKTYTFTVLAYQVPDYTYRISVRYTAMPCEHLANARFFDFLIATVKDITGDLGCQLKNSFYRCHVVRDAEDHLLNELFISFEVNSFGHGWERLCNGTRPDCPDESNRRVQKARHLIIQFFKAQPIALKEEFLNVPEITYIEHSVAITRLDSCRPGFGKNEVTHRDCSGCCVVCDPGKFNPDNSRHCEVCKDIKIPYYGATAC
ncbi:zona pellucida-binding protein 2 [Spea bombifrons]|uniref:zona pellucida-binding protein 2 n=1 Tax=Spea bombifrons TaxID=233779 RepID=UPI00234AC8B2|nr:zona pellucida-binding protein 2 [Spea bombifrons]